MLSIDRIDYTEISSTPIFIAINFTLVRNNIVVAIAALPISDITLVWNFVGVAIRRGTTGNVALVWNQVAVAIETCAVCKIAYIAYSIAVTVGLVRVVEVAVVDTIWDAVAVAVRSTHIALATRRATVAARIRC